MALAESLRRRSSPPWLPRMHPLPWAVVVGYFAVFLLLDWASFIRPLQSLNITPWNPQPALAVALLLASRRLWWVVWTSLVAADVLVRGLPGDLFVVATAAAALTCSYLAIASALQRTLRDGWRLGGGRDVAWFLAVIAGGALLSGIVYVGTFAVGGVVPERPLLEALARYWVGDAVGMVVALPIALAAMDARRRRHLLHTLRHAHWWLIAATVAATLWLLFRNGSPDSMNFSFLLLLPVIWGAARFGAVGALLIAAVTQVGLIVTVQAVQHHDLMVFELQLLMAAVTVTGLLLGVIVDERQRADAELRRSLRLAAAGQMSAALAHELSQPLTALAAYAQACQMLARAPAEGGQPAQPAQLTTTQAQLVEVAQRIAHDARRAGEVVRRLRDFFRAGATRLEPVAIEPLVEAALSTQRRRAHAAGVALRTRLDAALPAAWVDAVQIEVVLRNLVSNAVDAVVERGGRGGEVQVRASGTPQGLLVEVLDTGAGVPAADLSAVFEPGDSNKPGGMGVGLSICRAIVDAHGGHLWAEPGPGGRFCLLLPVEGPADTAADSASDSASDSAGDSPIDSPAAPAAGSSSGAATPAPARSPPAFGEEPLHAP